MKMINFTPELYQYLLDLNPVENPYLKELRIKTDNLKYARLRSPTEQIHFISFLLRFIKPKAILEIGTFTGYSTLAFALATADDTKIITCDLNNVFPETGQEIWKKANVSHRIQLRLNPALVTLEKLQSENNSFDFIFIDADKENNWNYFEKTLALLNSGGIIAIDNVLWRGQVVEDDKVDSRTTATRDFNKRLSVQPGINYCVLPIGDGITLVSKSHA
jgi:predicted O-methyltransferase YrrM